MSVTKYYALLVSDKTAAQNLMNIFLKEAGLAGFSTAQSLREAVSVASKELPHIIVCYDDLADATGVQVVEALRKIPILDKALVFVIRNSTQTEIMQLMKLKIAAIGPKDTNPNAFIEKVKQKLALLHGISPFSVRGEEIPGNSQLTIKVNTKIIGRHEGHVICRSKIDARTGTMLNIVPEKTGSAPFAVTFTGASSTAKGDGYENLFSMNEIVGKGRQWLQENLPSLDKVGEGGTKKKLLVLDNKDDRIRILSKAISIHNIETEYVADFSNLVAKYQGAAQSFGAVLFMDPPDEAAAASWEKLKQGLSAERKPIELVATVASKPKLLSQIIWLQKPFSLDLVVQSFHAAVASQHKGFEAKAMANTTFAAQYIAQAKIVTLDETGGIVQAPFLPQVGTELEFDHPFLNKMLPFKVVKVVAAELSLINPKMATVRFQVLDAGFTKEKLYTLISKAVNEAKGTGGLSRMSGGSAIPNVAGGAPKVTSFKTVTSAQPSVARPLWSVQKDTPMPKFNVGSQPKKP